MSERIHIAKGDGSGLTLCGAWEGAVDCMGRHALPDGPVCKECREQLRQENARLRGETSCST